VTFVLSFKLLRYINSTLVRFDVAGDVGAPCTIVIGYQPLLKWLTLLARLPARIPCHPHRKRRWCAPGTWNWWARRYWRSVNPTTCSSPHAVVAGSHHGCVDADIMQNVNLPRAVTKRLPGGGKYRRFLSLALACEAVVCQRIIQLDDIDAGGQYCPSGSIEWATQLERCRYHDSNTVRISYAYKQKTTYAMHSRMDGRRHTNVAAAGLLLGAGSAAEQIPARKMLRAITQRIDNQVKTVILRWSLMRRRKLRKIWPRWRISQ